MAAEIGQRTCFRRTERLFAACHGWFEQDWSEVVAIVAVDISRGDLPGRLDAAILECLRDSDLAVAPDGQGFFDVILGNLQGIVLFALLSQGAEIASRVGPA